VTEKVSLGRLNAAHAVANGNTRAAQNSAVGQLAAYAAALAAYAGEAPESKSKNLDDAAAALDRVANKELNTATIEALNAILGVSETVNAADVMAAVDSLRKSRSEDSEEDPTGETPPTGSAAAAD
jgi:hypothetical protein